MRFWMRFRLERREAILHGQSACSLAVKVAHVEPAFHLFTDGRRLPAVAVAAVKSTPADVAVSVRG